MKTAETMANEEAAELAVRIPADQQARGRIRDDLDTTLIVEAAAGTGKTTALVNRIVSAIVSGRAELGRIVAVTFTEKAAGELKLRLRAQVEQARRDPALDAASHRRLLRALEQLEETRIGTIHSFCADLLRERPVEAGVDPMFEVAPEEVSQGLFESAFDRWFERMLAAPGPGMRRLLARRHFTRGEGPRAIARAAALELTQWRDFDARWRPFEFERDGEIDRLVEEAAALGSLAADAPPDDYLARALLDFQRIIGEAIRLETVRARDYDALEATLLALLRGWPGRWNWRGFGESFGALERAAVLAQRDRLRGHLQDFRDRAGANLAPLLREELWPVAEAYRDLKRRSGVLDFLDLLLIARDLVRGDAAARAELQRRFTHIFIDEFQDTDPLQAEMLMLLAADDPAESDWTRVRPAAGKLFVVGDPKQSIYRFRRADVSLYQNLKRRLFGQGAGIERLTVSFRATPEIQALVNGAFAPVMAAESETQPAYQPLMPYRDGCAAQPAAVVLPVPAPYNQYGRVTDRQIEESLPDAAAAFVKWLIADSGWTVTERDDPAGRVKISPRHICLLFRRLSSHGRDVARPYVRALEARQVRHVLIKGGSFSEREEVEAIRNALLAIERPDDELAVFATLHGPLMALSDGALLRFKETVGSLHPFRKVPEGEPAAIEEVAGALGLLRRLHRGRNRRPIADTIARLLEAARAHAGFAIWPTGEQALANVMRVMDMARSYEGRSGATSFRGFVEELEARAERDETTNAPVVEEGTEGVRIMTVHRAKGLEFPVVLLADITCNETAEEARRHVDSKRRLCALRLAGCAPRELLDQADQEMQREREEAARLLYVAATRARDLLIVPAIGDEPYPGWLAALNGAIYPPQEMRRKPLSSSPGGCPAFGPDTVRERPGRAASRARLAVAPGLHQAAAGNRVVWWDPSLLELDVKEAMGLRQTRLLEADESKTASRRSEVDYQAWSEARRRMIEAGATPALKVDTATAMAARGGAAVGAPIEILKAPRGSRPHGRAFGALVHLTLLRVPLDATRGAIEAAAALEGRILGASLAEVTAAAQAAENALATPIMKRAAAALSRGQCRRECALSVRLDDGVVVEGVADLAFLEGENGPAGAEPIWTVVDFKTDLELAGRIDEYRAQLGLYVRAIGSSTGAAARGVLLWI